MLRIEIQSWNDVATLRCSGRLIFGIEAEMLRTLVLSRPESSVRINLSQVERIDAAGLGLLVELRNWATDTRRSLTLLDLSEPVWELAILTKLCATLEISYSDLVWTLDREERDDDDDECGRRQMIA